VTVMLKTSEQMSITRAAHAAIIGAARAITPLLRPVRDTRKTLTVVHRISTMTIRMSPPLARIGKSSPLKTPTAIPTETPISRATMLEKMIATVRLPASNQVVVPSARKANVVATSSAATVTS